MTNFFAEFWKICLWQAFCYSLCCYLGDDFSQALLSFLGKFAVFPGFLSLFFGGKNGLLRAHVAMWSARNGLSMRFFFYLLDSWFFFFRSHNPEVVGSNPSPATRKNPSDNGPGDFLLYYFSFLSSLFSSSE